VLTEQFRKQPSAYWLQRFEEEGVPAGPVLSISEMLEDPHVAARGMVTTVNHPTEGEVRTLGLPVRFSDTPGKVSRAAPLYGQHSREVLAELGYDTADIDRLVEAGAILDR
jgi:crotonobetainyl-CoA:carnitine CoA-transferase CaiB-like acyl-CoA transferase